MPTTLLSPAGHRTARQALAHFPRPDRAAAEAVRKWALNQGVKLAPDRVEVVTLYYQLHEGRYYAKVIQRLALPQALLANWQGESNNNALGGLFGAPWAGTPPPDGFTLVDELPYRKGAWDVENGSEYAIYNGLYRTVSPSEYSTRTHVPLSAEAFQAFVWALDFHTPYTAMLDTYWAKQLHAYGVAAKIAFIAACNKQVAEGSLSAMGQRLAWRVAGLAATPSWESLGKAARAYPVSLAAPLNIYGYAATDVLCLFDNQSRTTLLYIPGNASPLLEFENHQAMQGWVAQQCKAPATRQALRAHFALKDTPDGLDFSGLDTALAGLAEFPKPHYLSPQRSGFTTSGAWDPQVYINYKVKTYSPVLAGDLGQALAERQQQRSYSDATFLIETDSQVTKAKWRGYVSSAVNMLGPLALVVPELGPLFALGGVAQFSLGLDAVLNGKNQEEQAQGVETATFGLLNALPLAHSALEHAGELFSTERPGFFQLQRINGQLGYPLSPVNPPFWPEAPVAEAFGHTEQIAPLPGHDPDVATCVTRLGRWNGQSDLLEAFIDSRNATVVYDLEHDAFVRTESLNEVEPTRYAAPRNALFELVPEGDTPRQVSDTTRTATLRALGIDLTMPVDLATPLAAARGEIPHSVMGIWIGDKVLSSALLENVASNAQALAHAGFRFRLFLSNAHAEAYAQNLQLLTQQAPTLEVVTLETHPFYGQFANSDNFAQYQAAMGEGGGASNYSSASDVLRYPLLHHEGGIYLDVDDKILAPGTPTAMFGRPAKALGEVPLQATPDGLLLNDTVSNYKLGMRDQYNTSIIGSHAGNPTLAAISEEMHTRYQAAEDFYRTRPDRALDHEGFLAYTRQLSQLTGPGLLNDVIARLRPELHQLSQVMALFALPLLNVDAVINPQALIAAVDGHLPFNRFASIGSTESWAHT